MTSIPLRSVKRARAKWLQAAANIFDLIYKGDGGGDCCQRGARIGHRVRTNKTKPPTEAAYPGRKIMEWFKRTTPIAGYQIPNWALVLGAVIVIWLIYAATGH